MADSHHTCVRGELCFQVIYGPTTGSGSLGSSGHVLVGKQTKGDSPIFLQPPWIVIGWVFMDVADDLIPWLEGKPIGNHAHAFRGVLDKCAIVRFCFQNRGQLGTQTVQDRAIFHVAQDTSLGLGCENFSRLVLCRCIQRRDAAVGNIGKVFFDRKQIWTFIEHGMTS